MGLRASAIVVRGERALELVELLDPATEGRLPALVRGAWLREEALDLVREHGLVHDRLRRDMPEADAVLAREVGAPFLLGHVQWRRLRGGRTRVARGEGLAQVCDAAGLVREGEIVGGDHLGAVLQHIGRAWQALGLHERPHVREARAPLAGQPVERHEVRPHVRDVRVGQHPGHCTDGPRPGAWHRDIA
jgi:hypothetical protein